MNERIAAFQNKQGKRLACALVAGDPHLDATFELMLALSRGGADAIELVFPFSDPMFHGRVVQRATARARSEDVSWEEMVELVKRFREVDDETVVYATIYSSVVYRRGFEAAAEHLRQAGFDAISIPDMPWDEAGEAAAAFRGEGLEILYMISSTTSKARCDAIASDAGGFILWSAHVGGDFTASRDELRDAISAARRHSSIPVLTAMQVSTPEEARAASEVGDGVVVGSALIWQIEGRGADIDKRVEGFVRDIRTAIDA